MEHDHTIHIDERPARRLEPELVLEVWHRRRGLALLVFSAVLAGVVGAALALPDLYRATAKVLVENQNVSESFVRPSVTSELETRIQTIHQQITSRARLIALIDSLQLYPELAGKVPPEMIVERMRKDIDLRLQGVDASGRNSTIAFTLSYTGRDRATTADVANRLAGYYIEENTLSRERQAARTADFLARQVEGIRGDLDKQERQTTDLIRRYNGELPQQLEVNMGALSRLSARLAANSEYQQRLLERRERLESDLAAETIASGVVSDANIDEVQLARLKQELAGLRGKFSDRYPEVVRLRREIAELEAQMAKSGPSSRRAASARRDPDAQQKFAALDAELRELKQEESSLRRQIGAYEAKVASTPTRAREIEQISRGRDTTRDRYDMLMKQYEDARVAASLEQRQSGEEFRILDSAIAPRVPAAPNRLWLILLGCFAAAMCAIGAIVVAEKLDSTYHSPDELRESVDVPVLATIPRVTSGVGARVRRVALAGVAIAGVVLIGAGAWYVAAGNEAITRLTVRGGV
jgi:polysaccharide chain length determinant protein (PEP-CTERM system associated)